MNERIKEINTELTQTYKLEDDLYHRYGIFCGLSDPAVLILYSLYENKNKTITQNELVSTWFYPKQTINYTVNSLIKKGWIRLEQLPIPGNNKAILLTEEGKQICNEKIAPLILAEENSLIRMTEQEREILLNLTKKHLTFFEEEIQKITGGK